MIDTEPITEEEYRQKAYKPQNEEQIRQWRVVASHHGDMIQAELLRWLVSREANRITDGNTRQGALSELAKTQAKQAEDLRGLTVKIDAVLMLVFTIAERLKLASMQMPSEATVEALVAELGDQVFIVRK